MKRFSQLRNDLSTPGVVPALIVLAAVLVAFWAMLSALMEAIAAG